MNAAPMQGLSDWLRLQAEFGPHGDEAEAKLNRWASEVEAARASPADTALPEIIRILADWEDANGCLAAIMYDEWIALYKPITEAAVAQSPRMIRNEWQARLPAAVKDSLTTRPDDGVYSALTLASFAIKCLRDGIDIGEKLPDILQRIDAMLALRARPAEPTPSDTALRQCLEALEGVTEILAWMLGANLVLPDAGSPAAKAEAAIAAARQALEKP